MQTQTYTATLVDTATKVAVIYNVNINNCDQGRHGDEGRIRLQCKNKQLRPRNDETNDVKYTATMVARQYINFETTATPCRQYVIKKTEVSYTATNVAFVYKEKSKEKKQI